MQHFSVSQYTKIKGSAAAKRLLLNKDYGNSKTTFYQLLLKNWMWRYDLWVDGLRSESPYDDKRLKNRYVNWSLVVISKLKRDYPFSMHAKSFKKLTFLTPWLEMSGVCLGVFSENFAHVLNECYRIKKKNILST